MQLRPYEARYLPAMTDLINTHLAQVPPGWKTVSDCVARGLDTQPFGDLKTIDNICAFEGDRLVGAARATHFDRVKSSSSEGNGELVWVIFEPEYPEDGRKLVQWVTDRMRAWSCPEAIGYDMVNFFGTGWAAASSRWPHILRAMEEGGWEIYAHTHVIVTSLAGFETMPEVPVLDLQVHWSGDLHTSPLKLEVRTDGLVVGDCHVRNVSPHALPDEQWAMIYGLDVEIPWRRRGIGRFLLQTMCYRLAQERMHRGTSWNYMDEEGVIAKALYDSLGFETMDVLTKFHRHMDD